MLAINQENTDRDIRESAWKTCTKRILEDSEDISTIFDEMIKLRHQIAVNSGFKGYQEYIFSAMMLAVYSAVEPSWNSTS